MHTAPCIVPVPRVPLLSCTLRGVIPYRKIIIDTLQFRHYVCEIVNLYISQINENVHFSLDLSFERELFFCFTSGKVIRQYDFAVAYTAAGDCLKLPIQVELAGNVGYGVVVL